MARIFVLVAAMCLVGCAWAGAHYPIDAKASKSTPYKSRSVKSYKAHGYEDSYKDKTYPSNYEAHPAKSHGYDDGYKAKAYPSHYEDSYPAKSYSYDDGYKAKSYGYGDDYKAKSYPSHYDDSYPTKSYGYDDGYKAKSYGYGDDYKAKSYGYGDDYKAKSYPSNYEGSYKGSYFTNKIPAIYGYYTGHPGGFQSQSFGFLVQPLTPLEKSNFSKKNFPINP